MMKAIGMKLVYVTILTMCLFSASYRTAIAQEPAAKAQQSVQADPPKPLPNGTELLKSESIAFEPDMKPLPDIVAIMKAAVKGDEVSKFIAHMMYRDNIEGVMNYNNGKKVKKALGRREMHREMIRWREAAYEDGYELAILAANPSVQYQVSPMFDDNESHQKGMEWLELAAARGNGNAEYILGLALWNGVGTTDKTRGYQLLVRAAAHGVVNAYFHVGMIHELGLNGAKDPKKALQWLQKAADLGSNDAIFILAMKYADGIDVPADDAMVKKLEKRDSKYHAWTKLHTKANEEFYHKYCLFKYDESAIGWTQVECGDCEGEEHTVRYNTDDFDEDEDYTLDQLAEASLDYKIDYRVAANWLKAVANIDRPNVYILRSQIHHLTGCRGEQDDVSFGDILLYPDEDESWSYDHKSQLFKRLIIAHEDEKQSPEKLRSWLIQKADGGDKGAIELLASLYSGIYNDEELEFLGIKSDRPKAVEYYTKVDNYSKAHDVILQMISDARSNGDRATETEWHQKNIVFSENAYHWYEKTPQKMEPLRDYAVSIANSAHFLGDDTKALQWYNSALNVVTKIVSKSKFSSISKKYDGYYNVKLELAKLYENGSEQVQDKVKAYNIYKEILDGVIDDDQYLTNYWKRETLNPVIRYSYYGVKDIKPNIPQAIKYSKFAIQFCRRYYSDAHCDSNHELLDLLDKSMQALPKLDLMAEVEREIMAEKGKAPDGFFVIKKVLMKCKTAYEEEMIEREENDEDDEYYEFGCYATLDPLYEESIQKALTALTALRIATDTNLPKDLCDDSLLTIPRNTLYYLAIYKGNNDEYRDKVCGNSAVYSKLISEWDFVDARQRQMLFHIWYLRQIPYAASAKFKTLNAPLTWDEYMNKAAECLGKYPSYIKAFGNNPIYD